MKQCKALSNDRYQEIRKALEMGPTPGPWVAGKNSMAVNFRFVTDRGGDIVAYCDRSKNEAMANASFIAACEPDTIRRLLEERDALREALEDIRSLSFINSAMQPNPLTLTALLGDIHQIADSALAKEGEF